MSQKEPQFNYTGQGWEGKNYHDDLTLKDIAKLVRGYVKMNFPKCKFSVTTEYYAGGQSLNVSLMSGPFKAITGEYRAKHDTGFRKFEYFPCDKQHCQLNDNCLDNYDKYNGQNNGSILSREAWSCIAKVNNYINSFNFDDSDGMIDYSHTNFYSHLNIGKWDKPFIQI